MNKKNAFSLQSITKSFGGLIAVKDVSFAVNEKEVVGIIGPNGSGKTTLLDIVSGFLKPDAGRIFYDEADITRLAPHQRAGLGIGRLFQDIRVFNKLTVLENMLLAQRENQEEGILTAVFASPWIKRKTGEAVYNTRYWLDFVGLEVKENSAAENLSYGQEKLLALAMILARNSQLLLLDEPVAGLDLRMKEKILGLIKKLRDSGKTIIVIEHALDFIFDASDRIVLLNGGRKVYEGAASKFHSEINIKEAYAASYAQI
ncbi:MAG TPA: ABC transporter ATP-binding protein [Pyrinomonadaceae bacterium]|nr:ABC transporter ATP-binding protein [Pyrinomonadaceae bacterium]